MSDNIYNKYRLTTERQKHMDKYVLLKDLPLVKAGTIFVHDKEDHFKGSHAAGCLKLAWTDNGDTQHGLCAETIIFHADAIKETDWFRKIEEKDSNSKQEIKQWLIEKLEDLIETIKKL